MRNTTPKYYLWDVGNDIMLNDEFNRTDNVDSALLYYTKKEAEKARTRAKKTYRHQIPVIEIMKYEPEDED